MGSVRRRHDTHVLSRVSEPTERPTPRASKRYGEPWVCGVGLVVTDVPPVCMLVTGRLCVFMGEFLYLPFNFVGDLKLLFRKVVTLKG